METKRTIHVRFTCKRREELDEWLAIAPMDLGCAGPRRDSEGLIHVDGFATPEQVALLERAGVRFDHRQDITDHLKARMAEVGKGDRFEKGRVVPHGYGMKK